LGLIDDDSKCTIEWSNLKPLKIDKHQDYVFVAHLLLGIVISLLSLSGGWILWASGTGILTPIMISATGALYDLAPGINWYREEFVPYICKTRTIPEFEAERFLKYKLMHRRSILLSGYLSTAITQYVWWRIADLLLPIIFGFFSIFVILLLIFGIMIVLYLLFLLIWLTVFQYILNSRYSDVNHIIETDDELIKYKKSSDERVNDNSS
jgi:hypothetical protein